MTSPRLRVRTLVLIGCVTTACRDVVRVVTRTVALQEAFFREIDRRSPTPEIRERLRTLARSRSGDSVQALVAQGLARLDDQMLIRRMELMSVMLEGSDVAVCAALARGTPGTGQMTLAMSRLDGKDLDDWVGLLVDAQIASLQQRPARSVARPLVAQGVARATAALPDSEGPRMGDILGRFATASDSDACWAGRVLLKEGVAIAEPDRSALARGLVQP